MLSDLNRVDFANVQVSSLCLDVRCWCPVPFLLYNPQFSSFYRHTTCVNIQFFLFRCCTGTGIMGVPVWGGGCSALGAGLQGHATAAKLSGAVGSLAGECGHSGAQALRAPAQLPQGSSTVPAQVVLLQVCERRQRGHTETPPLGGVTLPRRNAPNVLFPVSAVLWWSGTWPFAALPALGPSTWFACCTTSTCFTLWSIGWLKLQERRPLESWGRYNRSISTQYYTVLYDGCIIHRMWNDLSLLICWWNHPRTDVLPHLQCGISLC